MLEGGGGGGGGQQASELPQLLCIVLDSASCTNDIFKVQKIFSQISLMESYKPNVRLSVICVSQLCKCMQYFGGIR